MANRRDRREERNSSPSLDGDTSDKNFPLSNNDRARDNGDETDYSIGGASSEPTREQQRREDNPFSFKHFLRKDNVRPNYNLSGARPKVYSPARADPPEERADPEGIYPCNPTELPDFVQDHLVIEQCYLNHEESASGAPLLAPEMENLPDFTINSNAERRQASRAHRGEPEAAAEICCDLPFDLTGGLERARTRSNPRSDSLAASAAALTNNANPFPRPTQLPIRQNDPLRNHEHFPFDLPPASNDPPPNPIGPVNSPSNDLNKSLPDFLNDGPIRNRVSEPSLDLPDRSESSLVLENERLRDELKIARRRIVDKMRMIESLKAGSASRRAIDDYRTANEKKAMEEIEVNLKRSAKRAKSADSTIALLKEQVKTLTTEVTALRLENQELRGIAGAGCADYRPPSTGSRIKKLSEELREAATSAENSLRQLMTGVNNLKVMASALENVDRIEDRTKDFFLPDFDEDNAAGPAL